MEGAPAAHVAPPARARSSSRLAQVAAALPLLALAVAVFVFYAVEAYLRKTPWIFTDELEWSQISRAIAETGHAARRGQPISFKSVYVFLIAPFWRIHSTAGAYAAIKYVNALLMPLAAIPTYLLARSVVSRRGALVAAVLSVAVPAMSYSTTIIIEVVAYPYYALCSWLAVRALRTGRRRDLVLAALAALGGLLVRAPQFVTLPISLGLALAALALTGPRGRALRRRWSRTDTLGVAVLALGAAFLVNRVVLQHVNQWQFTTEYLKPRMVDLGLRAGLGFTIGMGVLPVVGGIAALRIPGRRGDPAYRAFAAWLGSTLVSLSVYTALKAAYLSTTYATLWEERDLIYLAPLLIVGTVLAFESARLDWLAVGAGAALVAAMVVLKPFQSQWPYFEAPGFALSSVLSRYEGWSVGQERAALLAVLALSLLLLALRRRRSAARAAFVLGLAWLLAAEIASTVGIDKLANAFRAHLPTPLTWVDDASHGQPVTYLGQEIRDPNGEWLTEFWNRSIVHVESLDGSAPGPGPATTPSLVRADGLLAGISGRYVLADDGVALAARPVARQGEMVLYESPSGRWHLLDGEQQVYSDGWCPNFCAWTYFAPHGPGTVEVTLSRTAYNGSWPAGKGHVQVGTVAISRKGVPVIARTIARRPTTIENGRAETIDFAVASTPVRVVIRISNPIPPTASDTRNLGAQVAFAFVPRRAPVRARAQGRRSSSVAGAAR